MVSKDRRRIEEQDLISIQTYLIIERRTFLCPLMYANKRMFRVFVVGSMAFSYIVDASKKIRAYRRSHKCVFTSDVVQLPVKD